MEHEFTGKAYLIGGTSHCGKTSLGKFLSKKYHIPLLSTDTLARHPGRPWGKSFHNLPPVVKNYYSKLSVEEMIESVLNHYIHLWPQIRNKIEATIKRNETIIIEGSAILPNLVSTLREFPVKPFWIIENQEILIQRIYRSGNYIDQSPDTKLLTDNFIKRTIEFQRLLETDLRSYVGNRADFTYDGILEKFLL